MTGFALPSPFHLHQAEHGFFVEILHVVYRRVSQRFGAKKQFELYRDSSEMPMSSHIFSTNIYSRSASTEIWEELTRKLMKGTLSPKP